jgi:hypothetical protein
MRNMYAVIFWPMCAACPADFILLDLIISVIFSKKYELWSPCYAVFSNLLFFHPAWVKIFPTFSSQIPSNCVLPVMLVTKFYTQTKLQAKIMYILNAFCRLGWGGTLFRRIAHNHHKVMVVCRELSIVFYHQFSGGNRFRGTWASLHPSGRNLTFWWVIHNQALPSVACSTLAHYF